MIKLIFVGLWAIGLVTGTAFVSSTYLVSAPVDEENVDLDNLTNINIQSMSIAMLRNNAIVGYLIVNPIIIVDSDMNDDLAIPVRYYARDVIISTAYSNQDIDVFQLEKFDLIKFQKQIVVNLNLSLGKKIVHKVLIQDLDFISKEDVRDLQLRRS